MILAYTEDGAVPAAIGASGWAGSDGTWRYGAKASGASGDMDYVLALSRMTTDGYRDHSAARKNLGNARLGVQLDDASRLTIVANSVDLTAQDPLGLTYAQFQDAPRSAALATQYDTRKTVRQTQGGLVYERHVDGANTLRLMLYYGQRDTTQFQAIPPAAQAAPTQAGGVIDLRRRYGGADLRWTSELGPADRPLRLVGGFSYDTLREQRKGYQNYTGDGADRQLGVQGALRRDETNTVYNADPYLQASWRMAPRWTLDAGLRYSTVAFRSRDHYIAPGNGDDSGDARYRRALPVAALRYQPEARTSLYVSYGRGFETPRSMSCRTGPAACRAELRAGARARQQCRSGPEDRPCRRATDRRGVPRIDARRDRVGGQLRRSRHLPQRWRTRRDGVELGWSAAFARHGRAQLAYGWMRAIATMAPAASAPATAFRASRVNRPTPRWAGRHHRVGRRASRLAT